MNDQVMIKQETYTQDEAFQSSLRYFKGDELAARVWVNKYALKDSYGNIFEKNPGRYASSGWHVKLPELKRIIQTL